MADTENEKETVYSFFDKIREQNGINLIWKKVLGLLIETGKIEDDSASLKLFCILFSCMDDGNICICLDEEKLYSKWSKKWNGLLMVSGIESSITLNDYKQVIRDGLKNISEGKCDSLIENVDNPPEDLASISKLFVIRTINDEKWLFSTRNYIAKVGIENRIKVLLNNTEQSGNIDKEIQKVIDFFSANTWNKNREKPVQLEKAQAEIIVRGQKQNLIVTGGPGTGKTTAVCFLLWKLFEQTDEEGVPYTDYNLYLAAPSGKAGERMKESISGSLSDFKDELLLKPENKKIVDKLTNTDSSTVHRLLNYNPGSNGFYYNEKNQFSRQSIFIIDEASMIDIQLFRHLLDAIPEGARLFILGDKDQLPSVQEGAVLGDLLAKIKTNKVELTESKRFNESSQVGRLKNELQKSDPLPEDMSSFGKWLNKASEFDFKRTVKGEKSSGESNPVFFYSFETPDKQENIPSQKEQLKLILNKWSKVFCEDLVSSATFTDRKSVYENPDKLQSLWEVANEAKILCAERKSFRGVEDINNVISDTVCKNNKINPNEDGYFAGQLLIMTQNQRMFRLYNGDSGIVVRFEDTDILYLMVEKKASEEEENAKFNENSEQVLFFRIKNFMFYPLYLLPKESIETAYAITIHKSQGSGYKNIMVFLPEKEGHPLLNRQIAYTAVTRTEGNTYIVATKNALNYSKKTLIERDTMIEL